MDLKLVAMLREIQTFGNLTAAAQALFVSQPYLSKMIKQAELQYGVALVTHHQRPMQLTTAGKLLVDNGERVERISAQVDQQLAQLKNQTTPLKIGINQMLSEEILPVIWPILTGLNPVVELLESNTLSNESALRDGVIDLLFAVTTPTLATEFYQRILATSPLYFVTQSGNDVMVGGQFSLQKAAQLALILPTPEMSVRQALDDYFLTNQITVAPFLTTGSLRAALRMVQQGFGSTFIYGELLAEVDDQNLQVVPIDLTLELAVFARDTQFLRAFEQI
ncbi:MAG TPA: LysR family transcriptional regulator [Lactobacillaceae bacterium]|jgi:DNA-binding transcriptional LysR family regulator